MNPTRTASTPVLRTLTATAATVLLMTAATCVPATATPKLAAYDVDSSGCTRNDKDHWRGNSSNDNTSTPVRSGPGSEYRVKARMGALALMRVYCSGKSKGGHRWYYGRAGLDSNGTRHITGWVWSGNLI